MIDNNQNFSSHKNFYYNRNEVNNISRSSLTYNDLDKYESNMSKLDEDGKPILREDGKVLKGPNYKPPNLEDLV